MIQPDHPPVDCPAVPSGVDRPFDVLSCAPGREHGPPPDSLVA